MAVQTCILNICETASVSIVSAATASTSAPLSRLYDRDIGKLFAAQSTATLTIRVNQGTSATSIDRLIIPSGHNLTGQTVIVKRGTSTVVSTFMADITPTTAAVNSTWASDTSNFYEITISTPSVVPQFGELFLTNTYAWEHDPAYGGAYDPVFNVDNIQTAGGQDRFIEYGSAKKQRNYSVICEAAQSSNIVAFNSAWAGKKPFWLQDHTGQWIYSKLTGPIALENFDAGAYKFSFNTLEVIGT